jgi:hypothetical protein
MLMPPLSIDGNAMNPSPVAPASWITANHM